MTIEKSWCALFSTLTAATMTSSYFLANKASNLCGNAIHDFIDTIVNADIHFPAVNITLPLNVTTTPVPLSSYTFETPEINYPIRNLISQNMLDFMSRLPTATSDACFRATWITGGLVLIIALGAGTTLMEAYYSHKKLKHMQNQIHTIQENPLLPSSRI
jgi:hypothetical protein